MTIEYEFENDISKISVNDDVTLDDATIKANQELMKDISGCVSFGPLKVCYSVDLPKITISLSVFGIQIGKMTLDPSNPCQRISINLGIISGYVEICIKGSCLILNGKVCKFGSCTKWNNITIFCWG